MATASEVQSLENIQYKSKVKYFLLTLLLPFLFIFAFLSFYPVGQKVKGLLKANLSATGCSPDFGNIKMEWFFPKIVISDLSIPSVCLGRNGENLKFEFVTLNWHLVSFSPFGLPFRLDTQFAGQPISLHYVLGINEQLFRLRDQKLSLGKLQPLLGDAFKLSGNITLDLNLKMTQRLIKNLAFKAVSRDFQVPSQTIQGFTIPSLNINDLFLEANSENHPRINIDSLIIGGENPDSPIRANFKGNIALQEENIAFSPLNLTGEVAFSQSFQEAIPLIDMMFQSFSQKDGFYQIRLGGTLGAPKPSAP